MKRIVLGLAVVLAAVAVMLGAWRPWTAGAQGATHIVNDAGSPETECGTPDFTTTDLNTVIGDASVDEDDTLVLCEGTYDGGVVVNKKLTIEGQANVAVDKIVVEVAVAGTDGITLQADGAVVQHLFLDGPGVGAGNDNGILVDADNTTVSGVEASGWRVAIGSLNAQGTLVEESSLHDSEAGLTFASGGPNQARGNEITDNTAVGLSLFLEDQTVIDGNHIYQNDGAQVQVWDQIGMDPSVPTHVRFSRNDIETKEGTDGFLITTVEGDSLVQIGGAADSTNNFNGPFDAAAGDYYVELPCNAENTVDATYNWWGSTNRTDITNRIFNDADEQSRGYTECNVAADQKRGGVVFEPWAMAAWTPTATATPSPTATATATATPTATPPAGTRDFDLPAGWNDFVWTGASDTVPGTVLNCIDGDYAIAYRFMETAQTFERQVPGNALLSNMGNLDKYESLLVLVTTATQCQGMPVDP
jgi:hypothetical protein